MADLTSVTPILKEIWAPSFNKTFSEEVVALARIERTSDGITNEIPAGFSNGATGRYVVIPLNVTRNAGIGGRGERDPFPQPGELGWSSTKVRLAKQTAVGDITAEALQLANSNPRSFINTFDREQDGLKEAAHFDYGRQTYGSSTGSMGTVSSWVGATGVLTIDSSVYPYGNINFYGQRGAKVDIVDTSSGTVKNVGAATVTAVSDTANTITLSGTFGTAPAAGDIVVRRGSYNKEINGWNDMVQNSGTFQELAPATVPEWISEEITVSGTYTDKHLFRMLDKIRKKSNKTPTVFFTGTGVWRSIYDYLDGDRRFNDTVMFAHGVEGIPLHYKGKVIPIVDDPFYPENPNPTLGSTTGDMLAICESEVKVYKEDRGWHFAEETGSMFIPAQDRSDAWEFRMRQYSQLGTHLRNCHGRVNAITITA